MIRVEIDHKNAMKIGLRASLVMPVVKIEGEDLIPSYRYAGFLVV